MKFILKNEYKFIIVLFIVSFLTRLIIAPFFISPPDLPHDFYAYINAGEAFTRGNLYGTITNDKFSSEFVGPYGPLLGLMYAPLLILFGKNFFILKFPSIIFDSLNVLLVYYTVKNLRGIATARYAAIFYSFSYLVLLSTAVTGNNDNFELFWTLLAIYLLTKNRPNITLSAISLGISIGYVFMPVVILLPVVYYFYQINTLKNGLKYVFITSVTVFTILLPFYLKYGLNVLYPYIGTWVQLFNWPTPIGEVDGMTIPHLIKMLGYYFIYGIDKPYNEYVFPNIISTLSTLFGLVLFSAYVIKFKLNDKKIELIRNIFLIFFVGVVFFREFFYVQLVWMFPLLLTLITYYRTAPDAEEFEVNSHELFGYFLVIIGLIIYAALYKEYIPYSLTQRIILVLTVIPITIGTYMSLSKTDIKAPWTAVTFAGSLFMIMDARPLILLSPYIAALNSTRLSWGIYYFGIIVFMIIAMFLLLKGVHQSIQHNKSFKE